jgi:hypothetical protein
MHELKCKIPKQYVCKLSLLQECKSKLPLDLTDVNNYINQLEEKKDDHLNRCTKMDKSHPHNLKANTKRNKRIQEGKQTGIET